MDAIKKALQKLSKKDRTVVLDIIESLLRGETNSLDIKKLRGLELYRVRKGRVRVIYYIEDEKPVVYKIDLRKENTYKF